MTRRKHSFRHPSQRLPKTVMPRQVSKSQVESLHLEALYPTKNHRRSDGGHMMQRLLLGSMFRIQYVSIARSSYLFV
jgi:hypothetical protein